MQLTTLDVVVIVLYMALISIIGIYFSRRQTSREEYLLGGRSMHWMLLGGSMMATLLSTISFLSVPGEMIRYGIAYMAGIIAMPLFVPVANQILLPVLRGLPITSAYEYLEKRFDVRFRSLASLIFVLKIPKFLNSQFFCWLIAIIISSKTISVISIAIFNESTSS